MAACHDIDNRFVRRVRKKEGLVFLDVRRMPALKDKFASVAVNLEIAVNSAEDLLVAVPRFHESMLLAWLHDPVDHVTRMGVKVFHAQDIFAALSCRKRCDVKCS